MTLNFPKRTLEDIVLRFKNHTYKTKKEFITPLCKDKDNNVYLGDIVKLGEGFKVEGYLPKKCKNGEWIGEIHSHPDVRPYEHFSELMKSLSEDDVNHVISGKFEGNYKFPALFCSIQPLSDTKDKLEIEIQCEKYEDFNEDIIADFDRNITPFIEDPFKIFDKHYPKNKKIGAEVVDAWRIGDGTGRTGYPFKVAHGFWVDINKAQEEIETKGKLDVTMEEDIKLYSAIMFYQADMAAIKKGLRKRGLLKSGEIPISCKKQYIGRKKVEILQCSMKETKLDL